jgi:hypothetical protein
LIAGDELWYVRNIVFDYCGAAKPWPWQLVLLVPLTLLPSGQMAPSKRVDWS